MPELLLEIGLEEIPARMIAAAEAELGRRVTALLARERLLEAEQQAVTYSTPRRLAVVLHAVRAAQPDVDEQLTGPAWKVAFKEGAPTPAAHAFAKKAGVDVTALQPLSTPKGEYVSATVHRAGRGAAEVLAEHLPADIAAVYWPKSMYWRQGKPERFVRPLRWLLCLLGEETVPVEFAGIRAGNQTYGHRVLHGDAPIALTRPAEYVPKLESTFVLPDVEARRHRIRKALDAACRTLSNTRWREDHALVDQVTHLTEWPTVLTGGFEAEYLSLPEEVLVTVMRDHQKYFAVLNTQNGQQGKLAPHFLAVLNTDVDEQGMAIIRHGNERVLRARFNDARFFWNYDQKIPLPERVEMLKSVTFQKDLGSYFTKTETNISAALQIGRHIEAQGVLVDLAGVEVAARLAKVDLTTELVKEFTELQGIVGGLYARAQGLGECVAGVIYSQYMPASLEDEIPSTVEGRIFGLADRVTTLGQMFSIGLEPSGSKDPFALRRAGNAIIKILASGLPLTIGQLVQISATSTRDNNEGTLRAAIQHFLKDRLEFYLRDARQFPYDVVNAVLSVDYEHVPDVVARVDALTAARGSADFLAVSAAFKRIKNILRQAKERGEAPRGDVDGSRLIAREEQELNMQAIELAARVEALRQEHAFREALEQIATLRPTVDAFFDKVMVMDPDPELRRNRLALIASVLENFSRIADFSEIVTT